MDPDGDRGIATRALARSQGAELASGELMLDEFEAEVKSPGKTRVTVRLDTEAPLARQHFHEWLADLRTRKGGRAVLVA